MTQYQLPRPPAVPSPESRHLHSDLLETRAQNEFMRSDRQLLFGLRDFVEQDTFILGELETSRIPAFAHHLNAFGSMAIDKKIDVLELHSIARPVAKPTFEDIRRSQLAKEKQAKRHGTGRSITVTDATSRVIKISSFPLARIDQNINEFYAQYGTDRTTKDAVRHERFETALIEAQSILFQNGVQPALIYDPEPTTLSDIASAYPQIAMFVRLRTMFHTLGMTTEADVTEVVLAACGQRLIGLSQAAGNTAIDRQSHLIHYPGEDGLPAGEQPDRILPRKPKIVEE